MSKEESCEFCPRSKRNDNGYQCFHCGSYSVIWQNDFSFEDYCIEGEGIVHVCTCRNCGAEIEYRIRIDDIDE